MRISAAALRSSILVAGVLALMSGTAASAAEPRAVIELFTSQGCSSCPPADELLAKLADDPDVIPLSLPVDYWDRLGWKDTFAQHAFSERQRAYAIFRGDGQVYTPQAVINGLSHAVGSVRSSIDRAISDTEASIRVPVKADRTATGVRVEVGGAGEANAPDAMLLVMPILKSRDVAIKRGENAHRKVTYTNIVRDIIPVESWRGSPLMVEVETLRLDGADGVVVVLQSGSTHRPGAILGATRVWLR